MKKNVFLTVMLFAYWFSNAQSPVISSFSPISGPIGSNVTIIGTGFNFTPSQNIVFFGATKAIVTAANSTSLNVIVPLGATYKNISVTNLTVALTGYSTKPFTVIFDGGIAFANKQDFLTNTAARSIKIGDLDGDGKSDLVMANTSAATIAVLRNNSTLGTVSFAPKVDFTSGSTTYTVEIGDFNSDGKPDLVAVNGNNTISIFRNTSTIGTISFATKVDFATGSTPVSVSVGDITNDGKLDLAVTNTGTSTVSVLRNTTTVPTNIIFATKVDFIVGSNPYSVKIGDIDGDNKPDLVTANYGSSSVSILRNTSVSTLVSFAARIDYSTGSGSTSVSLGDIDGDGKRDIAINNESTNIVGVLRNNSNSGSINFFSKIDFATGSTPGIVTIGDVNGDGKPDLVVGNYSSASASVLQNTSQGGPISFASKIDFACDSGTYSIDIGDIDGDGKPDVAVNNNAVNTVSILRQLNLPQGSLSGNGSFCSSANGQLTFTATAGLNPFTIIYHDGTANRTVSGVNSGTPFNVFINPVTSTTNYTLISVSNPNNAIRTSGFTGGSATITVNTLITPIFTAIAPICPGGSLSTLPTTSNNNVTGIWTPTLNNLATTTYTFTPSANECATTTTLTIVVLEPANCYSILNLKLYIEGYYDATTTSMRPVKYNQGTSASVTDVETITLELHDAINYTVLETITGNLQTDGTAVGTFSNTPHGSYYIVAKGANFIESWSALPQPISTTPLNYDFTSSVLQTYGNNMIEVETGVWAVYSGDINQDDAIDATDAPNLFNDIENSEFGVKITDLNGDGAVDNSDLIFLTNNSENSIFSVHP